MSGECAWIESNLCPADTNDCNKASEVSELMFRLFVEMSCNGTDFAKANPGKSEGAAKRIFSTQSDSLLPSCKDSCQQAFERNPNFEDCVGAFAVGQANAAIIELGREHGAAGFKGTCQFLSDMPDEVFVDPNQACKDECEKQRLACKADDEECGIYYAFKCPSKCKGK
jgi:hypothetical protein